MIVGSFRVSSVTTVLSALTIVGAFACSSSSSGGDASSSSSFVDSYCSYIATCCGAEGTPSDGSQCRALFSLSSGTYDPAAGSACLAVVKKSSDANAGWCADSSTSNPAECNDVYKKAGQASNVAPGGKCSSDSDCAAAPAGDTVSCREYFGDSDGGANVQVCQVLAPGKAGDTCNGESNSTGGSVVTSYFNEGDASNPPTQIVICADTDGLQCTPSNDGSGPTTYSCTALGKAGDACTSDESCTIDTYCDLAGEKCAARAADGSSCSSGGQECVQADYCDAGSSTCIAKVKAGAACGTSAECQSNDCSNGKCGAGLASIGLALLCGGSSN